MEVCGFWERTTSRVFLSPEEYVPLPTSLPHSGIEKRVMVERGTPAHMLCLPSRMSYQESFQRGTTPGKHCINMQLFFSSTGGPVPFLRNPVTPCATTATWRWHDHTIRTPPAGRGRAPPVLVIKIVHGSTPEESTSASLKSNETASHEPRATTPLLWCWNWKTLSEVPSLGRV